MNLFQLSVKLIAQKRFKGIEPWASRSNSRRSGAALESLSTLFLTLIITLLK
jgi:hypothetical protein